MQSRYSKDFLWAIRNTINIDRLIKQNLKLSYKHADGFLRFPCPHCHDYHTATMKKTNLARCFRCKINFNTIDLVMLVYGFSFRKAVEYLKDLL
jgi:DNA primase